MARFGYLDSSMFWPYAPHAAAKRSTAPPRHLDQRRSVPERHSSNHQTHQNLPWHSYKAEDSPTDGTVTNDGGPVRGGLTQAS